MATTQSSKRAFGAFFTGNLLMLIATIFFGVNIPVVKSLIPQWLSATDVTAFRMIGPCVLFWIASAFVGMEKIIREHWLRILLGGMLGLFSFIYLFNLSLRYGNPIDISIIMTFPPIFVILIGVMFQHKKVSLMEIIGVVISFIGAVVVVVDQHGGHKGSHELLGDALAFASGICYAFYLVVLEKPSKMYKPVNILRWVFLAASLPALFLLPELKTAPLMHTQGTLEPWLLLAFVVVCPSFLSYLLINPSIKMIGSELVSIYQYLVPVVATIASVMMGLAKLDWPEVVAMLVIIIGMWLIEKGKKKSSTPTFSKNNSKDALQ